MKTPKKNGRPRKEIDPLDLPKIEALAGYGLSDEKIARVLGMDADTFSKRKREGPEVLRALEKGKAMAESIIGQSLFNKAKAGDLGSIVWWEKTRAGRVDSSQVRHADAEGGKLPPAQVTVYEIPDNGRGGPHVGPLSARVGVNGNGRST